MKNLLPLTLALFLIAFSACKEEPPQPPPFPVEPEVNYGFFIDSLIEKGFNEEAIPGLAIGVVRNGEIDWEAGYGVANRAEDIAVTKNTTFLLGGGSDLVLTATVQQVVDRGLLSLDEDINTYLPFKFVHPIFPSAIITMRMLLSHTSGIDDNTSLLSSLYVDGDSNDGLEDFLTNYLLPGGTNYSAANFTSSRPGKTYEYSRVAVSLIGYILNTVTGVELDVYSQTHIFSRLGLSNASWFLSDLRPDRIAVPYRGFTSQGNYGYPFYPSGQLRMSVNQMLRLMTALTQDGSFGSKRIVKPSVLERMKEVQYPRANSNQAIGWRYRNFNGRTLLGLSGSDRGISNRIYMDPATNVAVVILTNGQGYDEFLDTLLLSTFEIADTRL